MPTLEQRYLRGSEWRKWDLHTHAPSSALNNGFDGATIDEKWENYLTALETVSDIPVLGVTDYFSVDGFLKLRDFKQGGRLQNYDLLLPNVELRLLPVTDQTRPINIHVLFSPEIVGQLESHFFQSLEFSYSGNPYKCTRPGLIRLGRAFRGDQNLPEEAAYREGVTQFKVTIDHLKEVLTRSKDLQASCIVAVANSNQDGNSGIQHSSLAATRQEIYRMSHVIFSGNPNDVRYFCGRGLDSAARVIAQYGSLKPCLTGCDAHQLSHLFQPPLGRHTWVKADPTFQGLRQILNEPEDRVFIGDIPPSLARVSQRATRVARSVEIKKLPTASTSERWFDSTVPLNSELIAVIGNKGSGKSALSDVLGLLGNTPRHTSFSFLRPDRFRSSKNNKARQFTASLAWADGTVDAIASLDSNPSPEAVEKVKYIPQNYLEEICNEIGLGKGSRFYDELQQVIFSHVPEVERLGFGTLDELLLHRSEETNQAIEQLITQLKNCNTAIVAAEERLTSHHRKSLESQLGEKKRELEALTRPVEVQKPEADPAAQEQSKAVAETLERKQTELKALEAEITTLKASNAAAVKRRTTAEKLVAKLRNLERQVSTTLEDAKPDLEELNLTTEHLVTFTINTEPVHTLIAAIDSQRAEITRKLDVEVEGSPEQRRRTVSTEIDALQAQLSAPQRAYQAFLQALKEWELTQAKIIGNEEAVGTIKYFEAQLSKLDELPAALKTLKRQRNRKMLEIFREKQKLRSYYESYYGSVQNFLALHPLAASERFQLTFNVSMAQSGFAEAFLNRIHRRKIGPFMGEEEGGLELKRLLDSAHFDSALGTLRFTKALFRKMTEHAGKAIEIKDQLKQGLTLQELYDFVFSLSFLAPIYNLRWDGKGLEQLSPGERGNLLLIFYLLVDQDDIPLVIDQPEENLDNQTVFNTLVPCIKDAKKRRQIVLVTHNPNLAVVCDAEQIICAEMDKEHDNAVNYTSGSIEDPVINRRIVDILEGTRPAFDKRDDKYIP